MAGRDPGSVGYNWMAWAALNHDEPLIWVKKAADHYTDKLVELGYRSEDAGDQELAKLTAEIAMFLTLISEVADDEGDSQFKLAFRKAGSPTNYLERARKGRRAAEISFRREGEGWPTEAAVKDACQVTGLSRNEVFRWRESGAALRRLGKPE